MFTLAVPLFAVTEQAQQHQEQVDEVKIQGQRAHDRLFGGHLAILAGDIHQLDPLGVIGRQAGEHHHPGHRDHELDHGRAKEQVDQASDDDANQALLTNVYHATQ